MESLKGETKTLFLDIVKSMLYYSSLPKSFWGYALETIFYILNLVPSEFVSKTLIELWKGRKPSFNHIRIWGEIPRRDFYPSDMKFIFLRDNHIKFPKRKNS